MGFVSSVKCPILRNYNPNDICLNDISMILYCSGCPGSLYEFNFIGECGREVLVDY